jgi:hypothetical protein
MTVACRPQSGILMPIGSTVITVCGLVPFTIILPCGRLVQILPSASLVSRGSRTPYWHKNVTTVLVTSHNGVLDKVHRGTVHVST